MVQTQLVVSGSIAIDRIMGFSGHYKDLIEPAKLHVLSVSVLVDYSDTAHGGIGANIAHNLALFGDVPILVGSVGQDAKGYIGELKSRGIDTSHVNFSSKNTASFNVLNDSDNNQVGGFYPGAMSDSDSLSLKPWVGQDVLCWVAAHDPKGMHRQVEETAESKLRLGYDPGQQVSNLSGEDLKSGIATAEIFIINEYELEIVTKKTGLTDEAIKQKVPIFIVTRGENGSNIHNLKTNSSAKIPAVKPSEIVDPTGAGDAYRGGFLYGYLRQWDVKQCGQLGAVLASFVLEKHGPQVEISKSDIKDRYQSTFNEEIVL